MDRNCLFVIVGLAAAVPAQVTYHHTDGTKLVPADVEVEKLGGGMKFVEGPVWLADENALVFSDIPRGKLLRWTEAGGVVAFRDSEQSNGNTLDLMGRLISCQHAGRNVVRYEPDGQITVLAARHNGRLLNSPNDAVVRKDGSIWFTDPTYGLRGRQKEQPGNFVYRLDPATGDLTVVQTLFDMPNGICFSPDQATLYIADSGKKQRVGAFTVRPDHTLSAPRFWLKGGADGIRCDAQGNLYTTARDGVRIYSSTGNRLATIALPEVPANCAFGGEDQRDLFVTARTSLYRIRLSAAGASAPLDPDNQDLRSPAQEAPDGKSVLHGVQSRDLRRALTNGVGPGLAWLKRHQDEDGKWDCDRFMKHDRDGEPCDGAGSPVHDVGVTGLAMLALLGDGSTLRQGPHKDALKKAVKWLRNQQQENGLYGSDASHDFLYDHAIASYAMCEAYGLSEYKLLRSTAQKGLDYLEAHRNPGGVWRYQPRDGGNDTSITGWAIMACKTGEYFGLSVNDEALSAAAKWFDEVSDASGRHGYTKRGEPSSRHPGDHAKRFPPTNGETNTAVGLFARFFLGQETKDKPVMKAAADVILAAPPIWREEGGRIDHNYWFWASYAMYQVGGEHWEEWQRRLASSVLLYQHDALKNENLAGSWDPIGVWGRDGGRVYSTALLTMVLESSYRYSRFESR